VALLSCRCRAVFVTDIAELSIEKWRCWSVVVGFRLCHRWGIYTSYTTYFRPMEDCAVGAQEKVFLFQAGQLFLLMFNTLSVGCRLSVVSID
jgi:hypothetical protein